MIWNKKQIPILYEDKDVLAINKPAGLSVHGDGKSNEITLADLLLKDYPKLKNVGEPTKLKINNEELIIKRPGIVHRLDRDTSGVMIIAKNQKSFEFLKEQFLHRTTEKIYYAYVYGWLKNHKGTIDVPIARSPKDVRMWSSGRGKRGTEREAKTVYEVIKRIVESKNGIVETEESKGSTDEGTYTYVKLMPKTGRTHQLRVHMKYINHPIVSDPLYALARMTKVGGSQKPQALGFKRLALHASSLSITLPNKKRITVEAQFPKDFKIK